MSVKLSRITRTKMSTYWGVRSAILGLTLLVLFGYMLAACGGQAPETPVAQSTAMPPASETPAPSATAASVPTQAPTDSGVPTPNLTAAPSQALVQPPVVEVTLTETATPTLPPDTRYWYACPDSYPSNLWPNAQAYVNYQPPTRSRVRFEPGLQGMIVGYLEPGAGVIIANGPACVDNWVWWLVVAEDGSTTGWMAEGDGVDYWLVRR